MQKKQLQEMLEANNQQLNLFFVYGARELPDYNMTREKVNVILDKLIKIINENNSSNS